MYEHSVAPILQSEGRIEDSRGPIRNPTESKLVNNPHQPRWGRKMLFKESKIRFYERQNAASLAHAFENARNRHSVSRSDKALIKGREPGSLLAVNRDSRIIWGKAVCEQLQDLFCSPDTTDHNQTIYWVTLVDIKCAVSVSATTIDIEAIKKRLRSGLRGIDHLGVIEPAFYVNVQHGRFPEPRCIFWHLHALVWGINERALRTLIRHLQESGRYVAIATGFKGAHCRKIKQGDLPKVVGYMLKSPSWAYRLSGREEHGADGVVQTDINGQRLVNYLQGKSKLRPGERVTLFHTMKHHYLDRLAVAGGDGAGLLARAKRRALAG
jgi:hypothetical protein